MIKVELLRTADKCVYHIKSDENEVYLPYTEKIIKEVDKAKANNLIRYVERISKADEIYKIYTLMHGFDGISQTLSTKQVFEALCGHIVKCGKPTPEKRRYSVTAIPKTCLSKLNFEECKLPCVRISCNAKGLDVKTYAKYLTFKNGAMYIEDADEELPAIKGIKILIRPMNNTIIAIKG